MIYLYWLVVLEVSLIALWYLSFVSKLYDTIAQDSRLPSARGPARHGPEHYKHRPVDNIGQSRNGDTAESCGFNGFGRYAIVVCTQTPPGSFGAPGEER